MSNINIQHTLYPYQERDLERVLDKFKTKKKVLLTCPTGYGKTVVCSVFCKWFIHNYNKKCIILVNRDELVEQTMEAIIKAGLNCEKIVSSKKTINHHADVFICMEQTLANKLAKNKYLLNNIGAIVIDEAHYQNFAKHIKYFDGLFQLGLSATPQINERETFYKCDCCSTEYSELTECCGLEVMEWSRQKTMSIYYDDVVQGASIKELIEFGQLVPVNNVIIKSADLSQLSKDSKGEYTSKSEEKVFGNEKVVFDLLTNYNKYCRGKKTIIYTPNSKVCLDVFNLLKEDGANVRIWDSVNVKEREGSRKDLIKWFDENPDATIVNCNTFVAGFDNKEVEWIVLDRAFSNLNSYIQAVGRGGRNSNKIYKPNFGLLDLGGNYERFNSWDDDIDWEKIFWNGVKPPKAKKEPIENVRECVSCGALTSRSNAECEICGYVEPKKEVQKKVIVSDEIAQPISTPQPPNAQKIIEFVKRKDGDMNLAFKIFIEQVVMLFRFHQVSRELYESTKRNGKFDKKINDMGRKFYFQAIASDLPTGRNVKLNTFLNRVKENIGKLYQ